MAKFGINDIVNVKSMAAGADKVSEYKEIWLSPYEVKPSESNFYSQEKIGEIADSFLAVGVGQQQPSVLARIDGEFIIVSGYRRNLANIFNVERGYRQYEKVRYLYKDMTPAVLELSLLTGNIYNRELTAWERTRQAQRFKETLIRAKKEDGLEIKGSMRDIVEAGGMVFSLIPFFRKVISFPYKEITNVSSDKRLGIFSGKMIIESTDRKSNFVIIDRESAEELRNFINDMR